MPLYCIVIVGQCGDVRSTYYYGFVRLSPSEHQPYAIFWLIVASMFVNTCSYHPTIIVYWYCSNPYQSSNPYWWVDCRILLHLISTDCQAHPAINTSDAISYTMLLSYGCFAHENAPKRSDDCCTQLFDAHICHYRHSYEYRVVYCGVGIEYRLSMRSEWWTVDVPSTMMLPGR